MTETISPTAEQQPPPPVVRYDWAAHADGKFHQWRDASADENPFDSRRAYSRLRLAARDWAGRRGGRIESRSRDNGRQVWIAIHLPGGAA